MASAAARAQDDASKIHKPVIKRFRAPQQLEGQGFPVRRAIGGGDMTEEDTDPFFLLDEFPRIEWRAGEHPGAPLHPRHGILAACYIKEGQYAFNTSAQMAGTLTAGDCQWANAGTGIKVEEKCPGGLLHGFQCFVNLPRSQKRKTASVEISRERVVHCNESVTARLLAGECVGREEQAGSADGGHSQGGEPVCVQADFKSPGSPMHFIDFVAAPGGRFEHVLPEAMNTAIVYVYKGAFTIGPQRERASAGDTCLLWDRGSVVIFENVGNDEGGIVLVAGVPLREPVHRAGPIAASTRQELGSVLLDLQNNTFARPRR
jgi:redox-sensitive bicupin YhaK (pirin superfamily)